MAKGNEYVTHMASLCLAGGERWSEAMTALAARASASDLPRRELWESYREILLQISRVGLGLTYCMSYVTEKEQREGMTALYDEGYGAALVRVMEGAARLFDAEGNGAAAERSLQYAGIFAEMLTKFDPGKDTCFQFGFFAEELDAQFGRFYDLIEEQIRKLSAHESETPEEAAEPKRAGWLRRLFDRHK